MMAARRLCCTEAWPRLGPTVWAPMTLTGTGRAPARNKAANSLASSTVKRPLICPRPSVIGSWMTAVERISSSKRMTMGRPTFARVNSANLAAPSGLKVTADGRTPEVVSGEYGIFLVRHR